MNSRVPMGIEWSDATGPSHFEAGFTRVVNTHGCLLVCPKEIGLSQQVCLTNLATHQKAEGVVVWKGIQRPDGWDLGIELSGTDLDFWGIDL